MLLSKLNVVNWAVAFILSTPVLVYAAPSNSPADTLSTDPSSSDTVVVSAPQVTIEEVIEKITRRIKRDDYLMASYEYTTLITQVVREKPEEAGGNYKIEEFAMRHNFSREMGDQIAKLWERSRKFEDGEQVEDETDEEITAEFLPVQDDLVEEMPFSSTGGHRYHYQILDRLLVGNNLIYKISFRPKGKFEALPSGTIWVDYSNWVVRKFEARMTDTVPYPMFLESIPVYRMSQERFGDFWFPTEIFMKIKLRNVPLVPIPDNVELRVSLQDVVINGEALNPQDTAPGAGVSEISKEEMAGGFWLSEEASNDSLSIFWNQMSSGWIAELSPETVPLTLNMAMIDSLTDVGTERLQDLRDGNLWKVKPKYLKTPGYNRAQGVVAKVGLSIEKLGPLNPRLDLTAGFAFANQRSVYAGELDLPLVRSRRKLKDAPQDGRDYRGPLYEALSLQISGSKDSGLFAGDNRRHTRSFTSFFYGSDPNHYFEERGFQGLLKWRPARQLVLRAGGGKMEHRAWAQETSWNVLGRSLRPDGNLMAENLDDAYATAGASWTWGPLQLEGDYTWHEFQKAPALGSDTSRQQFQVNGHVDWLDKWGNQWLLKGSHKRLDGTAPVQMKSWLGDYGSLRGYGAGELTGDADLHASLDTRFGFDLFRMAKVPILKHWQLQPIGFVDWGKTWDVGEGIQGPHEGARGWRMDVGFGFGKRFDVPGLGEFNKIRIYAAHPVAEGSDGHGWRVLLGFEK